MAHTPFPCVFFLPEDYQLPFSSSSFLASFRAVHIVGLSPSRFAFLYTSIALRDTFLLQGTATLLLPTNNFCLFTFFLPSLPPNPCYYSAYMIRFFASALHSSFAKSNPPPPKKKKINFRFFIAISGEEGANYFHCILVIMRM